MPSQPGLRASFDAGEAGEARNAPLDADYRSAAEFAAFMREHYEQLRGQQQDRLSRPRLVWWICSVSTLWLIFVGAMVYRSADQSDTFKLSDRVLIAILSVTTAKILGLAYLVTKYLFHPNRIPAPKGSLPPQA